MSEHEFIIEASHLSKRFGTVCAVRDVSLRVQEGEIIGILGPSGSGKTTLIRMILGVYAPDSGTLVLFGKPSRRVRRSAHYRIGYMPQFFVLYPHLSILENLAFVGRLYGLPFWKRGRRVRELLEFLELWPHRRTLAKDLSGGMQRRVALAAALIHKPELLFLDEPTAGIDPILRSKMWDEFRHLSETGTTLVFTTQYVLEAEYANQVSILSEGVLVASGTPAELRQQAFSGDLVEVRLDGAQGITSADIHELLKQQGVVDVQSQRYDLLRLTLADRESILPRVLDLLKQRGFTVGTVENVIPSFEEVFVRLVEQHRAQQPLSMAEET
jgi:ABC-2 type transport system ATP-binding protein